MQKEIKKAQLLDELMGKLNPGFEDCNYYWCQSNEVLKTMFEVKQKYDELMAEKPLSKDPFADEVFSGYCGSRLVAAAVHYLGLRAETAIARKDLRLSHMPTLGWYRNTRKIGKKSLWVYEQTMVEYGFHEKLNNE